MNIFAPGPISKVSDEIFAKAVNSTRLYRQELAIPEPRLPLPSFEIFEKLMEIILNEKPAIFSFTFGLIPKEFRRECKSRNIITMGTATNLNEALQLEQSGIDSIIAQGYESGGHREMFSTQDANPAIDAISLTWLFVKNLKIPVVSAGGIMNGDGIARCLQAGAQTAQLGTAFLLCPESGISRPYREILQNPTSDKTELTQVFSGRWARGISNRFMREMGTQPNSILPWPQQNFFTRDIRKKAAEMNRAEFLSLWAGTGLRNIRAIPATELVKILEEELQKSEI